MGIHNTLFPVPQQIVTYDRGRYKHLSKCSMGYFIICSSGYNVDVSVVILGMVIGGVGLMVL